ncbi:MAG: methyltransferase [Candidatus Nanohaloarchaeota archaeon QJJ-7]|nr:methyltransferase [Candidatus Nanohaloarchaeota archaeon QJJ-7]
MSEGIYRPRKDSFLLKEVLEAQELEGKKVLDVGTGSGILAIAAAEQGAEVTAVDTNPEAVRTVKEKTEELGLDIDAFVSDLFEEVSGRFDLVVFNPPYVPGEEEGLAGEEVWVGGEDGREVIDRFLREVEGYLKQGGELLMVQSSRNDTGESLESIEEEGLEARVLQREELHFEELVVIQGVSPV